jgi:hypothetical protein
LRPCVNPTGFYRFAAAAILLVLARLAWLREVRSHGSAHAKKNTTTRKCRAATNGMSTNTTLFDQLNEDNGNDREQPGQRQPNENVGKQFGAQTWSNSCILV